MRISPFLLLCSIGLFAIFSSTISKSPVLTLFTTHLGSDPAGVGFIASVSAFTGIVVSIPAGLFSDRFGRRKMLFASLIVFVTAPFLYLLVDKIWQLAIVRFYHGIATAIFTPVAMALVADLFQKERGEKMGWFSTSTLIGRFMAPIVGGSIIGAMVFDPVWSFKMVYIVCAVAGVIAFLLAFRLPSENSQMMDNMRGITDHGTKDKDWRKTIRDFNLVLSNKTILITAIVEASILFAYGTFETFLPLYAIKIGLTAYEVGIFLSLQVITLALTKPIMGRFSDRHGRQGQIFWGALIGAICIGALSYLNSFLSLLMVSILFGLSLSIVTSATSAYIADLSKSESLGSAMGMLGSIMDIGHTTGPLISGIVALHLGIGNAFIGAGLVLLCIAYVFALIVMKGKTVKLT